MGGIGEIRGDTVYVEAWALDTECWVSSIYTESNAYSRYIGNRTRSSAIKHTLRKYSSTVLDYTMLPATINSLRPLWLI